MLRSPNHRLFPLAGRRVTPGAMSESIHGDAPVMGLHKLTAGDGYMYLIRQVCCL